MQYPPLRILYHHRIAASDGMRVHIEEIVNALRAHGHVVQVVGPGDYISAGSGSSALEAFTGTLRRILPAAVYEFLELLYNIPAWFRLSRAAASFRPDVLYERNNLFLLAGLYFKKRYPLPMILEINAPLASERAKFGNLRLRRIARACETALWRHSDIVLPVTEVLARQVRDIRGHDVGVHVMPNGARLDISPTTEQMNAVRERFGISHDRLVLGFVGFVRAWHGLDWAIEALSELPSHVHLLVVGDGPARTDLEDLAARAGVGARVHFSGNVPHHEIPAYTQLFDVALQTASVAYASPLKLFEYMTLGRAILAPDQPNMREILTDDVNALLFAPGERRPFMEALNRLCLDEHLRHRLGKEARNAVENIPLTWEHNAARIENLARHLIDITASIRSAAAMPSSNGVLEL
ncbi:MAG TPA: glycosyltransferase family 4 protein [Rhizomicrobium sp.]|jgi:glycosyltransferase involved in cell wall biosynthesis